MQAKHSIIKNYKIINIIFAGIFGLVFIYSGVFSSEKNNYPIHSACVMKPCKSTGLSRAFSEIVRLNFDKARKFNENSISVFLFFFLQFFTRIILLFLIKKLPAQKIILSDIVFSIALYLICFRGLLF